MRVASVETAGCKGGRGYPQVTKDPNHDRDPRHAYIRMEAMKMDKYHSHELTLLFTYQFLNYTECRLVYLFLQ